MKTLLFKEGQLTCSNSKSHITYSFDVEGESRRINISFVYQPKVLTDLEKAHQIIKNCVLQYVDRDQEKLLKNWDRFLPIQNLVTISLDDPERFRGAAHRHSPDQSLFLSEDSASPGFIKGKLIPGTWHVTISAHAIVTEKCNYRLQIWEEDENL